MASYFEEHNCSELPHGAAPNHLLHFARTILDGGWTTELGVSFEQLFPDKRVAPPASKQAVEGLEHLRHSETDCQQCPICIAHLETGEECVRMPCKHRFHNGCILPWLNKTNSCPVCRHELPTDDPQYETYRKDKKRQLERQQDIDDLHDSMFS